MQAPMSTNLLTQDLLDGNDIIYSGEAVREECGTLTPSSGKNSDHLEEDGEQQELMMTSKILMQPTQDEGPVSTNVISTQSSGKKL